jgi:hypothetical protein
MSDDSIIILASDGLLEFEEAEIEDVTVDDLGTHVLLKTGQALLLVGHEAKGLLDRRTERPGS